MRATASARPSLGSREQAWEAAAAAAAAASFCLRQFGHNARILFQRGHHHRNQRIGRDERLLQDAIGAHTACFFFVQRIEGADQENDGDVRKARIFLDELADFVAVSNRHEDIRQDQVGIRIGDASTAASPLPTVTIRRRAPETRA